MTADNYVYDDISDAYAANYGEPLVADRDWVAPIFDMVAVAVDCDPAADSHEVETYQEKVERTAAVIALVTYGAAELERRNAAHA